MKRIAISFVFLFAIGSSVDAQDYKKVRTNLLIKKLEEAKTELDKVSADPKAADKAETYLLKAEVYGSIAGDEALKAKYPTADVEAYSALKKYLELEPAEEKLKADNYMGINSIYGSLFSAGVKDYNAKNWDSAFVKFKDLAELGDLFTSRKWSNAAFDTISYLYAGATAQNAKKNEEAAKYYGKLAEQKVKGADYESIYDFLTKYYLNKNDQPQFAKYIALAKEAYPDNKLWSDLEFANQTDNMPVEDMVKKYEEADASKKLTAAEYLDYGDYFINNKKIKELTDPAQINAYTNRAFSAFSRAAELDTANGIASFNAGVSAYTLFVDASENARKIKGVTADIKAKRAQADKQADAAADKSIVWLEKAFNSLQAKADRSGTEKTVLSKTPDLLYNVFEYKKERSKVLNPKDYDKFDAKAKFYDALHGKKY